LLKIASVTESETAEFIAQVVKGTLKTWGISLNSVIAASTDGAAAMQCCVEKELDLPWMYCAAHVINRSVFLALDTEPIKTVVGKAKALCIFFHHSEAKRLLHEYQERLDLSTKTIKMCCPTRWGSVKKMLIRLRDARRAIASYLIANPDPDNPGLSDEEWKIIDDLLDVLCHLNEASQEISRQKVPTVGLIASIFAGIFNKCANTETDNNTRRSRPIHPAVVRFKEFLASDLRARWITLQVGSSSELLISAYLDPRTKDFAFVEEEERQECLERATSKVLRLAANVILEPRAQHTDGGDADDDSDGDTESPAVRKERAMNERMIRIYGKQAEIALRRREEVPDLNEEIERYTELQPCPLFPRKARSPQRAEETSLVTSDPLAWWRAPTGVPSTIHACTPLSLYHPDIRSM